jgi:Circularly permutated YpsA SLOG family
VKDVTILSGGQAGADRAALDFAIEYGLAHGGWCPRGRRAEDGPIDERYQLTETPSHRYNQRTEWNVRDTDATVVFSIQPEVTGGTALTLAFARKLGKPFLHLASESVSATGQDPAEELSAFLAEHHVRRLNIAGPRESQEPLVAAFVRGVLVAALDRSDATE